MSTNNKQANNSCVTTYRGLTEVGELEEDSGDLGGNHGQGRKDFGNEEKNKEDQEERGNVGCQGQVRENFEVRGDSGVQGQVPFTVRCQNQNREDLFGKGDGVCQGRGEMGQGRTFFGGREDQGQSRSDIESQRQASMVVRGPGTSKMIFMGREDSGGQRQGLEEIGGHEGSKDTLTPSSETFVRIQGGRVLSKDAMLSTAETFGRVQGGRTMSKEVPLSSAEALVRLLNRTMYPIVQENGQRRYGPPPDWQGLQPPRRGCEVFIGKIPRDCFEDELVPVFERIGPIYMFRLMMDFTGTNRGYGFCIYMNRDDTKRAVLELNNYEIRRDKPLGVCLSVDNCRLFVGGIPKNKTKEEIFQEMNRVTEGVKDVIAYPSVADKTKNRGFSFVEYDSHKSAAMARRKLIPGRIQLWGQQIAVDWAEPEREVNEDIMSSVKILYVRNLMLTTTEETLREKFISSADGPPDCVERVKKIKDYAFIHFKERFYAEMSLRVLNNTQIDNSWVEVSWAKPADKSESSKNKGINSSGDSPHPEVFQSNQIFIDSASGISYIGAPIQNLQTQPLVTSNNSPSRTRTGRRNAAGSRSITSNREKKTIEISDESHNNSMWPSNHKCEIDMNGVRYQYIPTQMLFPGINIMPTSGNNQTHEEMKSMTENTDALNHQNNISHEESILSISHLNPSLMTSNIPSNIDHNCQSVYLNVINPLQQYQGFPNQTFQIPQSQPYSYAMSNFYPQMSQTYPMMSHQVPQMTATSNQTIINPGYGQSTISMIPVAVNQMIDYSMNPAYGLDNSNYIFPNPISHIPNSSTNGTVQNVPIIVPISNPPG